MTIQQTPEEAKLAFELHSHAEIDSIRLLKSRVVSHSLPEPGHRPIALRIRHKARHGRAPEGLLRLEIVFHLTGEEETPDARGEPGLKAKPFLDVDCTWEVDYRLAPGYRPEARIVKAFKDGNAVFNCWPYFREYLQNTVVRMNLPPLTVPLLRLLPKAVKQTPARKTSSPRSNTAET